MSMLTLEGDRGLQGGVVTWQHSCYWGVIIDRQIERYISSTNKTKYVNTKTVNNNAGNANMNKNSNTANTNNDDYKINDLINDKQY